MIERIKAILLSNTFDKVRPFVWLFYAALGFWGALGLQNNGIATYVRPEMGQTVYTAWLYLHLVGAACVMIGFTIESASKSKPAAPLRNKLVRIGVQIQAASHACMFFALLAYIISAVALAAWSVATYSIVIVAPYCIATLLLFAQATTKIVTGRLI